MTSVGGASLKSTMWTARGSQRPWHGRRCVLRVSQGTLRGHRLGVERGRRHDAALSYVPSIRFRRRAGISFQEQREPRVGVRIGIVRVLRDGTVGDSTEDAALSSQLEQPRVVPGGIGHIRIAVARTHRGQVEVVEVEIGARIRVPIHGHHRRCPRYDIDSPSLHEILGIRVRRWGIDVPCNQETSIRLHDRCGVPALLLHVVGCRYLDPAWEGARSNIDGDTVVEDPDNLLGRYDRRWALVTTELQVRPAEDHGVAFGAEGVAATEEVGLSVIFTVWLRDGNRVDVLWIVGIPEKRLEGGVSGRGESPLDAVPGAPEEDPAVVRRRQDHRMRDLVEIPCGVDRHTGIDLIGDIPGAVPLAVLLHQLAHRISVQLGC